MLASGSLPVSYWTAAPVSSRNVSWSALAFVYAVSSKNGTSARKPAVMLTLGATCHTSCAYRPVYQTARGWRGFSIPGILFQRTWKRFSVTDEVVRLGLAR